MTLFTVMQDFSKHPKNKQATLRVIGKIDELKFLLIPRILHIMEFCPCKDAVPPPVAMPKAAPY